MYVNDTDPVRQRTKRAIEVGRPITVRVPGAVELTGISRTRLYELIKANEIETVKLGGTTLIVVASLERLIERLKGA